MNERVATGINGFDEMIEGGLPQGTVTILSGPAGSGKTLFGLQYIYNGAEKYNENGMYITFEESKSSLFRAAKRYNMNLDKIESEGKLMILDYVTLRLRGFVSKDNLKDIMLLSCIYETISSNIEKYKIKRLVLDSLVASGIHYTNADDFRYSLFGFATELRKSDLTSVLLTEAHDNNHSTRYDVEEYIGDGFIFLGLENFKGEYRRTVTVHKMRYTKNDNTTRPFFIFDNGILVQSEARVY